MALQLIVSWSSYVVAEAGRRASRCQGTSTLSSSVSGGPSMSQMCRLRSSLYREIEVEVELGGSQANEKYRGPAR